MSSCFWTAGGAFAFALGHGFSGPLALTPPTGFLFVLDDDGAYLTDTDGAYLLTEA